MNDPATVDRILTALGDLAPACRAWAPPPECCCWSGIQQAIDTVRKVAGPRVLTADDPEPGDMAVVLGKDGSAWQRDAAMDFWYEALTASRWPWAELVAILGPLRLLHDGGAA